MQAIKAVAAHLSLQERLEHSERLVDSEEIRRLRLAELRRGLAIGVAQADCSELRDVVEVFHNLRQSS